MCVFVLVCLFVRLSACLCLCMCLCVRVCVCVCGAVSLYVGSYGAVGLCESFAVACGSPVPVMAARAVLLGGGWHSWVGGSGLLAWALGWHCPAAWGVGACQAASLLVSAAGLSGWGWGSYLVLEASWWRPAFPGLGGRREAFCCCVHLLQCFL